MKEAALKKLVAGMTATMKIGSPVRQWMRTLRNSSRQLTPVHYTPPPALEHATTPEFVEVEIAKVMLPYAIVYHHNGRGWVKLWIDTREVPLYTACQ